MLSPYLSATNHGRIRSTNAKPRGFASVKIDSSLCCFLSYRAWQEIYPVCNLPCTPWWTFTAPQLTAIKPAACKCWLLFRWLMASSGGLRRRHRHFKTECDTVIKVRHENRTLSIFVLTPSGLFATEASLRKCC